MDFGVAELVPDSDRPGAWTLLLDGLPQSHVDTERPHLLSFEYMRRLASVVDCHAPLGVPLQVLHLGGGAMALARYVAATRPGSRQVVVERDAALVGMVRRVIPLPRHAPIKVRVADARDAVAADNVHGRFDIVLVDVPDCRFTMDFVAAVRRALALGGCVAMNIVDGHARAHVATMRSIAGQVGLMAEQSVLRGRRRGNAVLVAADRLPIRELVAATARDPVPVKFIYGTELEHFVAGARPLFN
ncbi:MAG TPA: fused MFS/spermidine synthase [Candidatus Limnocylindrales bacterium]